MAIVRYIYGMDHRTAALDQYDQTLLSLLQTDSQVSYAELGKKIGLSVSAVNERIKKLQGRGIISKYVAVLDAAKLDLGLCAFIHVWIDRPASEDSFIDKIKSIPEIQECHHVTGEFNYLLKVRVSGTAALEALLKEKLKSLKGVVKVQTFVVLSTQKETTALPLQRLSPKGETRS